MLTHELLTSLLEYDPETGQLFWRERPLTMFKSSGAHTAWNRRYAGQETFTSTHREGYLRGNLLGEPWLAHRTVWWLITAEWPWVVDHINGNKADNRIANLRNGPPKLNARNRPLHKKNTSGVSGVWYNARTSKWQTTISGDFLGNFDTLEEAAVARKAAETQYGFHENHGRPS